MEVKVYDKVFVPFISADAISSAVKDVAAKINRDYKDREPIFISALNGAFMFTSDLMKSIELDSKITFIKVASYDGDTSTGKVVQVFGLNMDIQGQDIIIVDDIIDSGVTVNELYALFKQHNPKSIAVATFIFKPNCYKGGIDINYAGIVMEESNFIIGYGLDYNQKGRNFPEIYIVK